MEKGLAFSLSNISGLHTITLHVNKAVFKENNAFAFKQNPLSVCSAESKAGCNSSVAVNDPVAGYHPGFRIDVQGIS